MYPTEQTEFVFLVDVGFDEYDIAIQQNINFEIMNHERSPVTFLNSKQLYGNCGNVPDKAKADNTVIIRSNSGIKYMRDRYASVVRSLNESNQDETEKFLIFLSGGSCLRPLCSSYSN